MNHSNNLSDQPIPWYENQTGLNLTAFIFKSAFDLSLYYINEKKNAIKTELTVSSAESQNLDETIPVTEPKTLESVNETESNKRWVFI